MTLGMFLRYVLEALKKPPGSEMSKLGSSALESFKQRLPEGPVYCHGHDAQRDGAARARTRKQPRCSR